MRKKTTIQYRKNLLIQNLSLNSKIPEKECTHLAGHNLFFDTPYNVIDPDELQLVSTGITFKYPQGTYGKIASRSGLIIKNKLNVLADVIDPDCIGKIILGIFNFGKLLRTSS